MPEHFYSSYYTLSLEAYLINGFIRLEVGFKGYEIPAKDYTAAEVVQDINDALASNGNAFGLEWDDEHNYYELGVNFGASSDQSQANLSEAVEILASYLPKYMKLNTSYYDDPKSDTFENMLGANIACYIEIYASPDGKVKAEIFSYVYNRKLNAVITVYDVASTTPTDGE